MWIKDKEWHGNPELGLQSWHKFFRNPLNNNRKTKVFVFGKGKNWNFVVSAGPNSDFSYTGTAPNATTAQQTMDFVDNTNLFR